MKKEVENGKAKEEASASDEAGPSSTPVKKGATAKGKEKAKADGPVKEKKIYEMPGQTKDTPPEEDPLRKFYTSLRSQRPDSQMARRWCAQYGLLSKEEAEEFVKERKEAGNAVRSPAKSPAAKSRTVSKPSSSSKKGKAAASSAKKTSAKKAPAPRKPAAKVKREEKEESEDEESSEDESDEEPFRPAPKKAKVAVKAEPKAKAKGETKAKPAPKAAAAAKPKPKVAAPAKKKDVAFADGGLGEKKKAVVDNFSSDSESDSDDDIPLGARKLQLTKS